MALDTDTYDKSLAEALVVAAGGVAMEENDSIAILSALKSVKIEAGMCL
jgi:hypothetical protein